MTKSHTTPISISIIVPMYNEEARIGICLDALKAYIPPKGVVIDRVIFADDGSNDRTIEKIKSQIPKIKKELNAYVNIVSYKENKGRGYALRTAMKEATGDYAIWLDADMSTPLSQIQTFLPYLKKGIPVVVGSRKIRGANTPVKQPLYRIVLGQGFSKLSNIVLGVPVEDFTCGFKAFSRHAYKTVFPLTLLNRWGNDSETLFIAQKYGFAIKELPILWNNDPRTKVKLVRDLYLSFVELFTIRWNNMIGKYELNPFTQKAIQQQKPAYESYN